MKYALAGVWFVTAAILVWVGAVLTPDAAADMDGAQRILFTAIPIRPFAWVMAAVTVFLAIRTARMRD